MCCLCDLFIQIQGFNKGQFVKKKKNLNDIGFVEILNFKYDKYF